MMVVEISLGIHPAFTARMSLEISTRVIAEMSQAFPLEIFQKEYL